MALEDSAIETTPAPARSQVDERRFLDGPVAPTLIPYLLARMDRSFAAARDLVAALDALALAEGRPVTRALAAALLDRHHPHL
jgi:hypothetical protein